MSDQFAVVQPELKPLEIEKLGQYLRGVPGLTPHDAASVCNENGGVLCKNLTAEQAAAFQANLTADGVAAEIIAVDELPVLPAGKLVRKVQVTPESLFVEDLVRGMLPIPWGQLSIIAAGSVHLSKLSTQESTVQEMRGETPVERVEHSVKETVDWFLRAELLLAGSSIRYSVEAERFNFAPLGEGVTRDLAANFCLLVRGLAAQAPNALLNRGTASIASEACEFVYYPRKSAFHDEITWMLWKAEQPGG